LKLDKTAFVLSKKKIKTTKKKKERAGNTRSQERSLSCAKCRKQHKKPEKEGKKTDQPKWLLDDIKGPRGMQTGGVQTEKSLQGNEKSTSDANVKTRGV